MARLVVVRHGQASLMKANYDELSERGRAQATALGRHFVEHAIEFDHCFSGPARRHHDTADLAAAQVREAGRPWPVSQEIADIDEHDAFSLVRHAVSRHGDDRAVAAGEAAVKSATNPVEYSGGFQKLFGAVMHRWLRGDVDVPEVETWPQFRERVLAGFTRAMSANTGSGRIIAFSSVGPLAVLLQRALQTDDATSFRTAWRIRNASLTTFMFDGRGRFTLDSFNALPHLPDPKTWTLR